MSSRRGFSIGRASISPERFDLLLSVVVTVVLVVSAWVGEAEPWQKAAGTAVAVGVGASLWWRRRVPVLTGVAVGGAGVLYEMVVGGAGTEFVLPLLIAFYSVGAYAQLPAGLAGFGLTYGATVLGMFVDPNVRNVPENAVFVLVIAGASWVSGIVVRSSRRRSAQLADLAAQLERERDERARLATAAERARIARELHDVVAHSISVIAVQAGAGRHALNSDPVRAQAAFAAIEGTAREALAEMRHMLGLLRQRGETTGPAPLPAITDCEKLIQQAKEDGLAVDLCVDGEPRRLPAGLDLTAYRIVQEALTNVRKHAPGARANVRISYAPAELEIEVRNDHVTVGDSTISSPDRGNGLIGMRERVALYGGRFEAGPTEGGGFHVRARMPVEQDVR